MSDETTFPVAVIGDSRIPCGTILQGKKWYLGYCILANAHWDGGVRTGSISERFILVIQEDAV